MRQPALPAPAPVDSISPPVVPDGGNSPSSGSDTGTERAAVTDPPTDADEQFPHPPFEFTDDEGRDIEIRVFDGGTEALLEMYDHMDPADRAQGIPPRTESQRESWLETLTANGLNLVAWHGGDAVGHAVLVPMGDERWELAIFVRSDYQHARIGTALITCLLGYGREEGVERVWLSVEQGNEVAQNLYESVGFETVSADVERKMQRDL